MAQGELIDLANLPTLSPEHCAVMIARTSPGTASTASIVPKEHQLLLVNKMVNYPPS